MPYYLQEITLLLFAFLALLMLLAITASLIEMSLRATWNKIYFTFGIPIVVKKIPVSFHHTNIPDCFIFDQKFKSNWFNLYPSLFFREVEKNIYGFCGASIGLRTGIYGVLIFDSENHLVTVKGYMNWGILCFCLLSLVGLPAFYLSANYAFSETLYFSAIIYGILLANLGFYYFYEYVIYSAIVEFAALSWRRHYVATVEG
jgi:hypothetical protein